MPIVNGSYVYQNLGSDSTNIQQQAFGPDWKPTKKDMSDYSAAAYNYMMKQQEQAYNLELWNLQNEYNSPAAQMARYQDAGLNPNLIYSQQNSASSPSAASAPTFRSSGIHAKGVQNALNAIQQIVGVVKSARDTYDYMKYGAESSAWQRNLLRENSEGQALGNYWQRYLLGMEGEGSTIPGSPRAEQYSAQTKLSQTQEQARQAYIDQVKEMVKLYPDQNARTRALKELDDYRLHILKGQNDFLLNIHTGSEMFDAFLRMMIYFGMQNAF